MKVIVETERILKKSEINNSKNMKRWGGGEECIMSKVRI